MKLEQVIELLKAEIQLVDPNDMGEVYPYISADNEDIKKLATEIDQLYTEPITEGESCDAFYEWIEHKKYTPNQKPAALQGWRAAVKWLQSHHQPQESAQERHDEACRLYFDIENNLTVKEIIEIAAGLEPTKEISNAKKFNLSIDKLFYGEPKVKEISDREIAMTWWNSLSMDNKMEFASDHYPGRSYRLLTGSEIEKMFTSKE